MQDLELSYRPVELRSCINQAYAERRAVQVSEIEWQSPQGKTVYLDVQISPLSDSAQTLLGVGITFADVTRAKRLNDGLEHLKQELEMANEELQAANEELETTNEELQSANEELETTNEELQSTNEELQTVNEELKHRSEALNQSNSFLESILTSLQGGVVVVNRDLRVQIWNHRSEDLWGLRNAEVLGQNFLNLDIGLPVEKLRPAIRSCLNAAPEEGALRLAAVNRRGKAIQCDITCTPLTNDQQEILGVILLMEDPED